MHCAAQGAHTQKAANHTYLPATPFLLRPLAGSPKMCLLRSWYEFFITLGSYVIAKLLFVCSFL